MKRTSAEHSGIIHASDLTNMQMANLKIVVHNSLDIYGIGVVPVYVLVGVGKWGSYEDMSTINAPLQTKKNLWLFQRCC